MKLAHIQIFRYRLRLARPVTSDTALSHREGLIIRLTDNTGNCGLGEAAPLPGFSAETVHDCQEQLIRWRWSTLGRQIPEYLEELSGGFEQWLGQHRLAASVRCAIETAVLSLVAAANRVPLRQLLAENPASELRLNALLNGTGNDIRTQAALAASQGFRAVKLKVGHSDMSTNIRLVHDIRDAIGPDIQLRLDANGAFDIDSANKFMQQVHQTRVAYIEEPVRGADDLRNLLDKSPAIPVAIDESLADMEPTQLRELSGLKAVIIKPALHGLERSMAFARAATALGATPVVTAMFESGLALALLAQFAASITAAGVAVGLDTRRWLAEDIIAGELYAAPGVIRLNRIDALPSRLVHDRLQEIPCD